MRMVSSLNAADHFVIAGRECLAADTSEASDRAWRKLRERDEERRQAALNTPAGQVWSRGNDCRGRALQHRLRRIEHSCYGFD